MRKPQLSKRSLEVLETCHIDLVRLICRVSQYHACVVVFGLRTREQQEKLFRKHRTQVHYPDSDHNDPRLDPISMAVDTYPLIEGKIPWPQDTDSRTRFAKNLGVFYRFAGIVEGQADNMGIPILWGGDWDQDMNILDNKFDDLGHFARKGDRDVQFTQD